MARSRNIKHGLYLNEELAELSIYARYLFPCLWCLADKNGRMEYRPRKIKAEAYPYDDVDIPALLMELHEKQFIFVYGHGTRAYIQVSHWDKHQNPHPKEKASELPSIDAPESIVATIGFNDEQEKQFIFTAKHGEAAKGQDEAAKFNLIPDSNPSDSLIPDSNPSSSDAKPTKMTLKEFEGLYVQTFGQMMPGMLNHDAKECCDTYPPDRIIEAFRITAEHHAKTFSYTKKVLAGELNGRQGIAGSAKGTGTKAGSFGNIDTTPKPAGHFAGDFKDRSDEW